MRSRFLVSQRTLKTIIITFGILLTRLTPSRQRPRPESVRVTFLKWISHDVSSKNIPKLCLLSMLDVASSHLVLRDNIVLLTSIGVGGCGGCRVAGGGSKPSSMTAFNV